MNKQLFSEKLILLRKKNHLTQQELADKLNVSNKTVSRWETGEGYPDIEIISDIADIYHVSVDYLFNDYEDFKDINKNDIVSYIPWLISIMAVLTYYIFIKLSIPSIFSFAIFYFITKFSYQFLNQYTDKKNGRVLTLLNTATSFFISQSLIFQIFMNGWAMSVTGTFFVAMENIQLDMSYMSSNPLAGMLVFSYFLAGVYAYIHYKKYSK